MIAFCENHKSNTLYCSHSWVFLTWIELLFIVQLGALKLKFAILLQYCSMNTNDRYQMKTRIDFIENIENAMTHKDFDGFVLRLADSVHFFGAFLPFCTPATRPTWYLLILSCEEISDWTLSNVASFSGNFVEFGGKALHIIWINSLKWTASTLPMLRSQIHLDLFALWIGFQYHLKVLNVIERKKEKRKLKSEDN